MLLALLAPGVAHATCPKTVKTCVPLAVFASPDVRDDFIADQIQVANDRLRVVDVAVERQSRTVLPHAHTRIETRADRNALFRFGTQTPLRVFFVAHLADSETPSEDRKGVTWRRGDDFLVIVVDKTMGLVLAHELGHVFGLPHSREYRSIMNKTPRPVLPQQLGYTPREQPIMRRTLRVLREAKRL